MISFVNAARAPIRAIWVRRLLTDAASLPEMAARLPGPDWSANLRVAGDRELRRLNARFMADDHATDVLSFPSGDPGGGFLGDLVISWQAVVRQAGEFNHLAEAEFALLAVHGFLHLLGWDHATRREAAEMDRIQLLALQAAGLRVGAGRLLDAASRG